MVFTRILGYGNDSFPELSLATYWQFSVLGKVLLSETALCPPGQANLKMTSLTHRNYQNMAYGGARWG